MKITKSIFTYLIFFSLLFSCLNNKTQKSTKSIKNSPVQKDSVKKNIVSGLNKMISQNREREFLLRTPSTYIKGKITPLVIVFQGNAKPGSVFNFEKKFQFSKLGEKEGFITVYPVGLVNGMGETHWRPGILPLEEGSYSDITFILDLIEAIKSQLSIDHKRIYLVGHSDGAFFTYNFSLQHSDKIAAIAISAGLLTKHVPSKVIPPLPIIHLHGLQDKNVPAVVEPNLSPFLDAQKSLNYWITNNGASSKPEVLRNDDALFIRKWNASKTNNADVVYIQAKKIAHLWFREINAAKISGTNEIWNFFKAHPKQ